MLKEEEKNPRKDDRIKYVERAGNSIGNILCKSHIWAGRPCSRDACLLCKEMTGENTTQSCTKRNIVNETWCQRCKDDDEKKAEEEGRDKSTVKI